MDYTKRRWRVLIASCIINLCIGSMYAWSVFAGPILEKFNAAGANLTSVSIVFTVANAVGPITMISGGFLNQKLGPRKIILIGGIMFGLGMILSGFAPNLTTLIITYGLLAGLGIGMVYGATVSTSVRFFPDKKGLVGGLTSASYGVSTVIISPIAARMLQRLGVQPSFLILGGVMLALIIGASCFVEACPDGFIPEGYVPKAGAAPVAESKDWKGMLATPVFYIMLLMILCGAFSGLMVTSLASPISREMAKLSVETAATVVSMVALFNTFGRIAAGTLSDKIGEINTLAISFVLALIGQVSVYLSNGSLVPYLIGLALIGFCFGSLMGVYPAFTVSQFGPKYNGTNYGIMFIGFAIAGYFGPTIMNSVHASTGEYRSAFLIAAAMSVAGLCLNAVFRIMKKKKNS